jgi:ATP/maltotriose-dependent transcriptional regulator MalT
MAAGSGKTALLVDWARRGQWPVAWLSLDAGDNDPARFWRHAVAALDGVCPGIGDRLEAAEQLVDAAELGYAGATGEPFEPTIGQAGSLLVNVPAFIALHRGYIAQLRGDIKSTAQFASQGLADSREGEWILRSVAHGQLAVAAWLSGRLAEAERTFREGIAGRQAAGLPTWSAWESYELGQVQHAQGRLDAVVRTCEQALEATARTGRAPLPAAGPAYVELGEVAYQRNELDSALRHVTDGIPLCRSFVYTVPLAAGLATLAWIRQATGDPAGALRALALAASGEEAAAVAALAEVLALACPQGYVRVFTDEGPPMAALLGRLIAAQRAGSGFRVAAGIPLGCLARLHRSFDAGQAMPDPGRGAAAAVPGLVEQLTSRELEVLAMLAAGRSNQAIASQFVVTLDTVKKHVSHVLSKLGAANRTEAVSRARELGLIP